MRRFLLILILVLTACGEEESPQKTEATMRLVPASFSDLPGWADDDLQTFSVAFARTCTRMLKAPPEKPLGPLPQAGTYADWQPACREFRSLKDIKPQTLRAFLEKNFTPHAIWLGEQNIGLFTGYYEAALNGSRTRQEPYVIPLYKRPEDLIMVDLGQFREELKGQRIAGRVEDGNLRPYETREQIVAGDWPHNDKPLVWVDDAVDAFYVEIQGSGIVTLPDGSEMRIGYAGQNGHPYTAIGKELIARGALTKENVSMQAIREWLSAHPDQATEIMNVNKSYVFFTETKGEGPLGGENVPLTPERSMAIDRSLFPYGLPFWLEAGHPLEKTRPIRRLMIGQDTGGAIRGAIRGDVFWGHGPEAEHHAGPMKSQGRYWVLLPRKL
jgi:membrane-bound lytic murein transglycosylase A